jgi:uncharacterized membrane protein YraQ (UPF0718 family)
VIDPITAFATAQAAIKGVQAAIKMGKDIGAISGDLMKFFEAKDVVAKAAAKPKKATFGKSDTAQAFETVIHAKQLQDAENELKQMLIWSGNADVWQAIMVERNNIVHKRKAEENEMAKAKANRKKEIEEVIELVLLAVAVAGIVTLVAWGTMEYVDFMRR